MGKGGKEGGNLRQEEWNDQSIKDKTMHSWIIEHIFLFLNNESSYYIRINLENHCKTDKSHLCRYLNN